MMRLLFSGKALWHQWRALKLVRRAHRLLGAAEAHAAQGALDLVASRSLATTERCCHDGNTSKVYVSRTYLRPAERMLLASIVGLFIAALWIWITARAGR